MSARPLPIPLGAVLADKYRIDAVLGVGGMGTVFAAENIALGRQVAIKVLHADLAQDRDIVLRLRQEARAAAAIGHPGIVDVLDLGTTDTGDPFIVMERLEGQSLGTALAETHHLPPPIAVGILGKAAEALAAAHAKGIIHRDLKPDNIFLVTQPAAIVKLVDFGISKQQHDGLTVTTSGVVMGTPLYMSPEQARGARDVGPASDLYSLGAILYQTLAGRPPLTASNYNEMMSKILMEQPTPLSVIRPNLPRSLTDLADALLAKDSARRPTAQDLANRLRTIGRELDSSTIAFSPTLQPDNVTDPVVAEMPPPQIAATDFATPAPVLGATVASIAPGHAGALSATAASATAAPAPISATFASPEPRVTPAATASAPARSRVVYLAIAIVAVALAVVVVLATRPASSPSAAPADAAATPVVDAAAPTFDALATPTADAAMPTTDAAAPIADAMAAPADAPPPAVDARKIEPTVRDAGALRIDAAAGSGLEIDETFPGRRGN